MNILMYITAALAALIVLRLLFSLIAAPIIVHSGQKQIARPRFDLFDPRNLPPDKADYFAAKLSLIHKEGFEPVSFVSWESHANQRILFALAVNRDNRDAAIVVLVTSGMDKNPLEVRYTEFSTEFTDSSEICSNNNPVPDVLKQFKDKKVFSFRQVKDPHHLYILHRKLLARFALGKEAVLPPGGKEVGAMERSVSRFLERQLTAGYFRTDGSGDILRPTWKGAFLMTWKQVWPMRFIRNIFYRRHINTLLRQLLASEAKPAPQKISEQVVARSIPETGGKAELSEDKPETVTSETDGEKKKADTGHAGKDAGTKQDAEQNPGNTPPENGKENV